MAKYLLAFLLLAAAGTAIVIVGYPAITTPESEVNVAEMRIVTESSQESSINEPEITSQASLTWKGSYEGDRLYLEKQAGNDYYIVKTFEELSPEMNYTQTEDLTPGEEVKYRLVLMNKGKSALVEHQPLIMTVPSPIPFLITDTILPEDEKITLKWENIDGFDNYKAEIAVDDGTTLASRKIEGADAPLVWNIPADKFEAEKNYMLTVTTINEKESYVQEVKSSRIFRIGQAEEETEEEIE